MTDWPENDEYYLFFATSSGQAKEFDRKTVLWLLREGYIKHRYDRLFDGVVCHYFEK